MQRFAGVSPLVRVQCQASWAKLPRVLNRHLGMQVRHFSKPVEQVKAEPAVAEATEPNLGFFGADRMVAEPGYSRWAAVPPVLAIQGSIGSIYAWSIFNSPLTRELGVISAASGDWGLDSVVPIFSTTAVCFGFSVWGLSKTIERLGPRAAGFLATGFWGSGLAVAAAGTYMHTLPLLYAGYGVLGGLGFAFGYVAPVANMIRWFPDKRGLATGLGVMSFGGGALLCAPLSEFLMKQYRQMPEMLGTVDTVTVITEGGKRLAKVGDQLQEVVVGSAEAIKVFPEVIEGGIYLVGSGDTGLACTFASLSAMYTCLMLAGALGQRSPWPGYLPKGYTPPVDTQAKEGEVAEETYVPVEVATRLPQFKYLWLGVMGNAMAGVSIISCAKTIMGDVFGTNLPMLVDGAFAASYVAGLSLANMSGRLGWATASDFIGRRNVYLAFGALGVPMCLMIPQLTSAITANPDPATLWMFVATSAGLVTCYGGLLGVLPAYISDTFGLKNTTSIFARAMTGWATAALVGPKLLTTLRGIEYEAAVTSLALKVTPEDFQAKFGAPLDQLPSLLEAKVVTIRALMEICPPGTLDPTAGIYDSGIYCMSGALTVAFAANLLLRPVSAKHFVTAAQAATKAAKATKALK